MPKITSVEPQKKSANRRTKRFNIFLDGSFAFGADEDLVVDRRLVVGKLLDTSDVEQLVKEAEIGKLMERMYRLFNIRQRSEKEIRDYLKNLSFKRKLKGDEEFSTLVIDTIVQLMKRKGTIDDKGFANSWMEARLRKYGPIRIKQELYKKGIDKEIIQEVMSSELGVRSEEVAMIQLERKLERWKNLQSMEFRKKAYDFLLRRGFDYEMVKNIVEKYIKKR